MKLLNEKPKLFGMLFLIGILLVTGNNRGKVLGESESWVSRRAPNYQGYHGKPKRPDLGQSKELKLVLLNETCRVTEQDFNDGGGIFELKLNEAFLVTDILDYPDYTKEKLGNEYDQFLVVQGFSRNLSKDEQAIAYYPNEYMLLKESDETRQGWSYGGYWVAKYVIGTFWTVFSVKEADKVFVLEFCPNDNSREVIIDFTSDSVKKLWRNYSVRFGLFLDN